MLSFFYGWLFDKWNTHIHTRTPKVCTSIRLCKQNICVARFFFSWLQWMPWCCMYLVRAPSECDKCMADVWCCEQHQNIFFMLKCTQRVSSAATNIQPHSELDWRAAHCSFSWMNVHLMTSTLEPHISHRKTTKWQLECEHSSQNFYLARINK